MFKHIAATIIGNLLTAVIIGVASKYVVNKIADDLVQKGVSLKDAAEIAEKAAEVKKAAEAL